MVLHAVNEKETGNEDDTKPEQKAKNEMNSVLGKNYFKIVNSEENI